MRRSTAAVGSAVFFLLAPGVVVGLIPWWLTGGWQVREPLPYWAPMRPLGGVLLVAGLIALVRAFARFVVEGLYTGAGRRARASGRRRGVSLRSQPHVRGGTDGHRRPVVAPGQARISAVRWRRLGSRSDVRAVLRGTHPTPTWGHVPPIDEVCWVAVRQLVDG
jgi:hypothetical protein